MRIVDFSLEIDLPKMNKWFGFGNGSLHYWWKHHMQSSVNQLQKMNLAFCVQLDFLLVSLVKWIDNDAKLLLVTLWNIVDENCERSKMHRNLYLALIIIWNSSKPTWRRSVLLHSKNWSFDICCCLRNTWANEKWTDAKNVIHVSNRMRQNELIRLQSVYVVVQLLQSLQMFPYVRFIFCCHLKSTRQ